MKQAGGSLTTRLFDGPIAEYATKRAAERFAKRLVNGGHVKRSSTSAFDMYWPKGKIAYQVFENED